MVENRHAPEDPAVRTLIDELLEQQQSLTAVERFALRHERDAAHTHAPFYRDLIPLDRPRPGEQYAFAVNLDDCTGCKACVTACHNLNGLDEGETWRNVGVLFGGTVIEPVQQTVTTACHHCVNPACLEGCPVLAYEKDSVTGIVRHLDDQCIGCQYCVLKCPYDVPKYSKKRGIVRKCDMCSNRLSAGEAPACVQACPSEAIRIEIVNQSALTERAKSQEFLPESPDPTYTLPSTQYRSRRTLPPNLLAGDAHRLTPEHAHFPLIWMLVITQVSVGAFCVQLMPRLGGPIPSLAALVTGILGILIGTAHLGRPLYAWRAVLGLRTSWLSREIIGFGLFAQTAMLLVAVQWLPTLLNHWPHAVPPQVAPALRLAAAPVVTRALGWATALAGLLAVFCSVKIYEDTRRDFWRMPLTLGKFFGTTAMMGIASGTWWAMAHGCNGSLSDLGPVLLIAVASAKLAFEARTLKTSLGAQWSVRNQSALLMRGPLRLATALRFAFGIGGGILLPLLALACNSAALAGAALALCFTGEILERYLYFTAVVPPRMPGGIIS